MSRQKDGCMENKQVKDAAEDALGLDLTDMAKMYPVDSF